MSATIYKDPSGRYFVMDPLPYPGPDAQHKLVRYIRPLFDGETASILNRTGTAAGRILPPVPPSTYWTDPTAPEFGVVLRGPFPALHYGQLLSHQNRYYILEFGGARLVPDVATLAAKGYAEPEATPVSDADFLFIPLGSTYLPVPPPVPILVKGDARADIYLYPSPNPPTKGGPAKALLIGHETLFVYNETNGAPLVVSQAEIDAVPLDAKEPKIENLYVKTLTIKKLLCVHMSHGSFEPFNTGGDDMQVRLLLDDQAGVDVTTGNNPYPIIVGGKPDVLPDGLLVRLHSGESHTFIENNVFHFSQVASLRVFVHDSPEWTKTPDDSGTIWIDTPWVGQGEKDLNFWATGNGAFEYHLTVQVDYYKDNGKFVAVAPSMYPDNIYKITHFFVLMMENRAFDHILGANPALAKKLGPLALPEPKQSVEPGNMVPFQPAPDPVPFDLGHEINDVLGQLVGYQLVAALDANGKHNLVLDKQGSLLPKLLPSTLSPTFFFESYQARLANNHLSTSAADSPYGCMQPRIEQAYATNQLAEDFVLCARWHASVPGPTWPNRFFLHAGTSGGISVSPDTSDPSVVDYTTGEGFDFTNKTIFQRLTSLGYPWRIYHSGEAQVWAIQGMSPLWNAPSEAHLIYPELENAMHAWFEGSMGNLGQAILDGGAGLGTLIGEILPALLPGPEMLLVGLFELFEIGREIDWVMNGIAAMFFGADSAGGLQRDFSHFASDLQDPSYQPFYTFIEPDQNKNSGHPLQPEGASEDYIRSVYKALRASPLWESGRCALLVVYDEHGGFYDHVPPPQSPAYNPHDDKYRTQGDQYGKWPESYHDTFDFSLLGLRVPAIIISPYTYQGGRNPPPAIREEVFEHASVIKTLQRRLKDPHYLTPRVTSTNDLFGPASGHSVFGNRPLSDVAPAPMDLDRYRSGAPAGKPPAAPEAASALHPNVDYMIQRAGEINYRCSIVNDPSVMKRVTAQVPAKSKLADAASALTTALSTELSTHRAAAQKAIDATTPEEKTAYLDSASAALEQYRTTQQKATVAYRSVVTTTSPKARYAAVRTAVASKVSAKPTPDYPDGVLLRGGKPFPVSIVRGGRRRILPDTETFAAMELEAAAVWTIPDTELEAIPNDGAIPSLGGLTPSTIALDVGATSVGTAIQGQLTLTLHTPTSLDVSVQCTNPESGFAMLPTTVSIPGGQSVPITFTFTPHAAGLFVATLRLEYNSDGFAFTQIIVLTGAGILKNKTS